MSAISLTPCTYFNIKFENNAAGIFHPGDTINGIVELYVEKRIKKTKGLKLEVTGVANCEWTRRKIYKIVKYEGTQKFMEHVSHFFGRVDGAAIEVSVGVHLYKFSCVIPKVAASSYVGINGSIKYSVKVTLDIPFMRDIVYEKLFTIVRIENLNDFPWLRCKSDSETDLGDGIDCCETMPLVVSMKISKSGFAAGEELKTRIEACNQGPSKYSKTTLTLFRTETCSSQFPIISTKKTYFPIAVTPTKSIKPFESTFFEQSLMIPDELIASSPISSETVRIGYFLRFSTKSNRRTTVKTDISVFIGHIPLVERNEDDKDECDKDSEPVEEINGKRCNGETFPGMVVNCEVKFDNNPNAIFFAGQTLSGVVELTIDKPKKIRGLVLKIEGYAKVEWTESERSNRSTQEQTTSSGSRRNVIYSGREDYMSSTSYLIGSPEGNQIEIAPGQYRYNFQSVLPPQLPTSCETNHGSIRYLVNVILDRPFKFDLTYKTAFTIIKQLDLNYENPSLTIPLKMDTSKTYCCWFCKTKPLHLSASIPQSGYVPGQMVNVYVEVRNDSRFDVLDVVVALLKVIKYNSQIPKLKTKEETVTETLVRYGEIKKESRKVFNQQLIIPPVPPSNSSYCRLLNVSYEVEVRCNVVKFASDPFIRLPIIVGTVPLNIRQTPVYPTAPQLSTSPMSVSGNYEHLVNSFRLAQQQQPQPQSRTTNELPPPSYAEAVYAEEQGQEIELSEVGEHTMGTRPPYHPMYPFYNFNNSQAQSSSSQHENGIQSNGGPGSISDSAIVQKY